MSLSDIEGDSEPDGQKKVAHKILKMFNPGAVQLINGTDIDRPMNALTLTHDLHTLVGNFELAFEPVQDQLHTYKIDYVTTNRMLRGHNLPVTRTLYTNPYRNIEPPSPQLLEIHRAIGHILHLSAAGEYVNEFIRDMEDLEEGEVCSNGSTRIADHVRYKVTTKFSRCLFSRDDRYKTGTRQVIDNKSLCWKP